MPSTIILFDTEYTAWEGSQARRWSEPWEHREIIQIAAMRVTAANGFCETARFQRMVRPARNPQLSAYIRSLTGISQAVLDTQGVSFVDAFTDFSAFCKEGAPPLFSWGDDPGVLRENCALAGIPFESFTGVFYDIRDVLEQAGIETCGYSSGTVYQALALPDDLPAHDAMNDVTSLRVTLAELSRQGRLALGWLASVGHPSGSEEQL